MILTTLTTWAATIMLSSSLAAGYGSTHGGAAIRMLSTPHADTSRQNPLIPYNTTQPVLTVGDFAQLQTFLRDFIHEWKKPEVHQLLSRDTVLFPLTMGNYGPRVKISAWLWHANASVPNYVVIADRVPAIAKALAHAKLTGQRYLQLTRAVFCAAVADVIEHEVHDRLAPAQVIDTSNVTWKNVLFIRAHPEEYNKLRGIDVDIPDLAPFDVKVRDSTQNGGPAHSR